MSFTDLMLMQSTVHMTSPHVQERRKMWAPSMLPVIPCAELPYEPTNVWVLCLKTCQG